MLVDLNDWMQPERAELSRHAALAKEFGYKLRLWYLLRHGKNSEEKFCGRVVVPKKNVT